MSYTIKTKWNRLFICDNSHFLETLKVGSVHSHILRHSPHLLSGEASPVPAQHVMHPAGHGLIAVAGHLVALFFILQLNMGRRGLVNLQYTCRSTSLPPHHSKETPPPFFGSPSRSASDNQKENLTPRAYKEKVFWKRKINKCLYDKHG